jgi:hypothetical protein
VSARIRAGSRFNRLRCFILVDVRCFLVPQVGDHAVQDEVYEAVEVMFAQGCSNS